MAKLLLPDSAIDALESTVILPNRHLNPSLGVIIKADAPKDDTSYLHSILKLGEKYNVNVIIRSDEDALQAHNSIEEFKANPAINGIILLSHFGGADAALYRAIPTRLDIDCLSPITLERLMANSSNIGYRLAPCAAVAVYKMLEYNGFDDLAGCNVAILGRSLRIGRPLAEILCQKNATITLFHTKSPSDKFLEDYDIVISAIGQPKEISFCKSKYYDNTENLLPQTIIDVGINVDGNGKLCGDVDINSFPDSFTITPTPGGVGRLATVVLFCKVFYNSINPLSGAEV